MKVLTVNSSKKYDVTLTKGMDGFLIAVKPLICGEKVAVITDSNVNGLYKNIISDTLKQFEVFEFVIRAGEKSKNAKEYLKLINKLAENGFTRKDTVIAFGGGVVGDLAAFVASTYMRGITLISVPTTLLSMVDSSVGGKTGIDLACGKNLCGTFYQPSAVYINVDFLNTLPEREIKCGFGEILKYGYLGLDDKTIFDDDILKLIADCIKIKAEIVEKDEKESGERKLLNLGHTFGHAIEKAKNYKLSHGECVAKGIRFALIMSENYYDVKGLEKEFTKLAQNFSLDLTCDVSIDKLIRIMQNDKKRSGDSIDFVLVGDDKKAKIVPIKIQSIKGYLK
ncbi:MAG: 3-dehydroquinate synthase [Clostridia bacterium]|nr:3-dehydroquinate synthase [Clostridia bacterium]